MKNITRLLAILSCGIAAQAWALQLDNHTDCKLEYTIELNGETTVATGKLSAHESSDTLPWNPSEPAKGARLLIVVRPICDQQPNLDSRVAAIANEPKCVVSLMSTDNVMKLTRTYECIPPAEILQTH